MRWFSAVRAARSLAHLAGHCSAVSRRLKAGVAASVMMSERPMVWYHAGVTSEYAPANSRLPSAELLKSDWMPGRYAPTITVTRTVLTSVLTNSLYAMELCSADMDTCRSKCVDHSSTKGIMRLTKTIISDATSPSPTFLIRSEKKLAQ